MIRRLVVMMALVAVAGCGVSAETEQWFTLTIIKGENSDGTPIVEKVAVSLSDQIAMREERHAAATGQVGSIEQAYHSPNAAYYPCDSSKLWIFDQAHETGNSMCFSTSYVSGDGCWAIADLASYCVDGSSGGCSASWWSRVRSYWVPNSRQWGEGYFQTPDWSSGGQEWFNCYSCYNTCYSSGCYNPQPRGDCSTAHEASWNAQNARYIVLDPWNTCGALTNQCCWWAPGAACG